MSVIRSSMLVFALVVGGGALAAEPDDYRAGAERFVIEMATRHGLEASELRALLAEARYQPAIIESISRPYESKPWRDYRPLFLTPERIQGGVEFWQANAEDLTRAESTHGVAPEVIVAIIGVETNYGGHVGRHRVLDALTTLGFSYPKRADFFRSELEQFLLLAREESIDPLAALGSYAGAMGLPQFIASSYRTHAVDFDGDGRRDLWGSRADAVGSVAHYLERHGWRPRAPVAVQARLAGATPSGIEIAEKSPLAPSLSAERLRAAGLAWDAPAEPDEPLTLIRLDGVSDEYWLGFGNFHALTRYNRSNLYAMAVHQLSQAIRERRETHAR